MIFSLPLFRATLILNLKFLAYDGYITDASKIANNFNNYFVNIGKDMCAKGLTELFYLIPALDYSIVRIS